MRVIVSIVSGKYNNCTYLHIHIIHIIPIHPNTNSIHSNTNSIQIPIHPNTNPSNSNQTNSIHQYPISNPNQIPCGRSIHYINNILTSSIVILLHQISIHQFNPIQSKYQFIQQFQFPNNQHV